MKKPTFFGIDTADIKGKGATTLEGQFNMACRNQLWAWTCLWSILPGTPMVLLVLMCASIQ